LYKFQQFNLWVQNKQGEIIWKGLSDRVYTIIRFGTGLIIGNKESYP